MFSTGALALATGVLAGGLAARWRHRALARPLASLPSYASHLDQPLTPLGRLHAEATDMVMAVTEAMNASSQRVGESVPFAQLVDGEAVRAACTRTEQATAAVRSELVRTQSYGAAMRDLAHTLEACWTHRAIPQPVPGLTSEPDHYEHRFSFDADRAVVALRELEAVARECPPRLDPQPGRLDQARFTPGEYELVVRLVQSSLALSRRPTAGEVESALNSWLLPGAMGRHLDALHATRESLLRELPALEREILQSPAETVLSSPHPRESGPPGRAATDALVKRLQGIYGRSYAIHTLLEEIDTCARQIRAGLSRDGASCVDAAAVAHRTLFPQAGLEVHQPTGPGPAATGIALGGLASVLTYALLLVL